MSRMNSTEYTVRAGNVNTGALPRLTLARPVELRQLNRHGFFVLTTHFYQSSLDTERRIGRRDGLTDCGIREIGNVT
ncbi:MAG: hypothetical protein KDI12_06475 [Anaerolineae bacterium]|nr:hypothetical protein [Anaerolineae bacterium]